MRYEMYDFSEFLEELTILTRKYKLKICNDFSNESLPQIFPLTKKELAEDYKYVCDKDGYDVEWKIDDKS